jgi:hypothetical protein
MARGWVVGTLLGGLIVAPVGAEEWVVPAGATLQQILAAQQGKRVTIRMGDGGELSGLVRQVNPSVLHLGELVGKEFFDAVVALDKVGAVIVRTKP